MPTLIPDVQGSVIGRLDATTAALSTSGFLPFGGNRTDTASGFRYTSQQLDPETAGSTSQPSGLYYYRARSYSPAWGRFLQPDPIGYAGGRNLYAYVENDPLNLVDPSGHAAATVASAARSVSNSKYVQGSFGGFAQIPGDIEAYATDLRSDPLEFLRKSGPTLAGIVMPAASSVTRIPVVGRSIGAYGDSAFY